MLSNNWLDNIQLHEFGYYQKCTACDWTGQGLDKLVDSCPECGGDIHSCAALVEGGLIIITDRGRFYFRSYSDPNYGIEVDRADVNDVIEFMICYKPY